MRLLVISNNTGRPSYRHRIGDFLGELRQQGIYSDVLELDRNICRRFAGIKAALSYDAVFLHKKRLNILDAFLMKIFARRVIYDFDDAVMYYDKQPERKSTKRIRDFARTVKLADTVIAGNSYLARQASIYNRNVEILPTGLNVSEYDLQTEKINDGKIRLVWIGSKSTLMYLEELRDVFEEIGRIHDNVVLRIICDEFFDLDNMQVEKCLWSLDSQAKALRESDIGLAPLPDDSFTRGKCGFKILQYMAASLPVVASPVGVNSEIVDNGLTGYTADTHAKWIEAINKLIGNKKTRISMGKEAKGKVASYDLKIMRQKLAIIIEKILSDK